MPFPALVRPLAALVVAVMAASACLPAYSLLDARPASAHPLAPVQGPAAALAASAVGPLQVTVGVPVDLTVMTFTDTNPGAVPTDAGYVGQLFQDLLQRGGDGSYWVDLLAQGSSRRQVTEQLTRSEEYRRKTVVRWWNHYLGRPPDASTLAGWASDMAAGTSVEVMRALLIGSEERRAKAGRTDAAFLADLYQDALGRAIDPGAASFYGSYLASGTPHAVVAYFVLVSPEARQKRAGQVFQQLLGRAPDQAERALTAAGLALYGEPATVAELASTDEYYRRQPSDYSATIAVGGGGAVPANVVRRLDGSYGVVARIAVGRPGDSSAQVTVRRSTGEMANASVAISAVTSRNERFIDQASLHILGRRLGGRDVDALLARIPAGGSRTRSRVALDLLVSYEGRQRVVQALYRQLLGREASGSEARYWADGIGASNVMVVRALLLGSDEAFRKGGATEAGWIDSVYRRVMGRGADRAGLDHWLSMRSAGLPRPFVAFGILITEESRRHLASQYVQTYLGRRAQPQEIALGAAILGAPAWELGFPALLIGSDEYYSAFPRSSS